MRTALARLVLRGYWLPAIIGAAAGAAVVPVDALFAVITRW